MPHLNGHFSRRDFLKLLSLLPLSFLSGKAHHAPATDGKPGVIILLLDALTASNLSLYGYPRKTSPNLERFAERANVYHAHYAAGNFTMTGTASLLTGTYPWAHRAFHYAGRVIPNKTDVNLFKFVGGECFRLGYSQNPWIDLLLYQFSESLDSHIDSEAYNIADVTYYNGMFENDSYIAYKGVENFALEPEMRISGAPLLGFMDVLWTWKNKQKLFSQYKDKYSLETPTVLSNTKSDFLLEDLFDGVRSLTETLPERSMAYLHLYPPHRPYAPRMENMEMFANDGWKPLEKEKHFLAVGYDNEFLEKMRLYYDAYISTLDVELGSLFDFMADQGILDNNYVIITSDHGEIFERGEWAHQTPMLFEPLVRIPLLISAPGQTQRIDITEPTSCLDVLPTILSIFDKPIPQTLEGRILPGFAKETSAEPRSVYFMDMKNAAVSEPIAEASIGMRKGRYKALRYYSNKMEYPKSFEIYDIESDPEELHDLGETDKELAASLVAELDKKLEEVNRPYIRG